MKLRFTVRLACSLCFLTLWGAGCASTGYQKSDATARSMQQASLEVASQSRALELTVHTLRELTDNPGANLEPQFKRFSKALDKLMAAAERNKKADREITEKSTAYFEAWDKELASMSYEVVRASSQARRTDAFNDFQSVHQRYLEAQTAMEPMLSYLDDIRRALRSDLTQKGLEAIKPIVTHAEENASKVQIALNRLTNELNASGSRLSSLAFQTVTPTGPNGSGANQR